MCVYDSCSRISFFPFRVCVYVQKYAFAKKRVFTFPKSVINREFLHFHIKVRSSTKTTTTATTSKDSLSVFDDFIFSPWFVHAFALVFWFNTEYNMRIINLIFYYLVRSHQSIDRDTFDRRIKVLLLQANHFPIQLNFTNYSFGWAFLLFLSVIYLKLKSFLAAQEASFKFILSFY